MRRLTEAMQRIRIALADMPTGCVQRIDGLRCSNIGRVIDLGDFTFKWALRTLIWNGEVERSYRRQFFPSLNGMPYLALTPAGRAALAQSEEKKL